MTKTASPLPRAGWDRLPGWALVLLVLVAYGPALRAGFIWDDDVHFAANPRMATGAGLVELWTTRWAVYYPLTSTTFWVLRRIAGLSPWVYHAFTLGLHIANALLLARVLRGLRIPGAWLGAALFALHPVQVESVAWVTELKNTQAMLFLLISVYGLIRSGLLPDNRLRRRRWYTFALGSFVLAVLSKPAVVMLPPVLLVLLWWRRLLRTPRDAWWVAPYFVAALMMAGWTIWEQRYNSGAAGFEWAIPWADRWVTAGRLATFYFQKLIWPSPLMFIYPELRLSAAEPRAWLPLLAVVTALVGVGVNARDWGRPILAAGLIYLLFLFPILGFFNVYFMRYAQAADHFQYFALLAPCALAGAWATRADEMWTARYPHLRIHAPRLAGWAVVLLYAMLTWRHTHVFQSNEHLWRDTIAKNPKAWMAHNNLGLMYWDRGQLAEAEAHFRAALAANPRHYEALCNLGAVGLRQGRLAEARAALDAAIRWQPQLPQAWFNLGRVHEKTGDWDEAQACFQQVLALQPNHAEAHARLALRAEEIGDVERALWHHRRALEIATNDPRERAKYLNERAARFISRKRWALARAFLDLSQAFDPDFSETRQLQAIWRELLPPSESQRFHESQR